MGRPRGSLTQAPPARWSRVLGHVGGSPMLSLWLTSLTLNSCTNLRGHTGDSHLMASEPLSSDPAPHLRPRPWPPRARWHGAANASPSRSPICTPQCRRGGYVHRQGGRTRPTMFTVAWETQPGAAALSDKENCWKLFPVEETSQSKHLLMTSQVWQNAGWGALSEETQALPARSRPLCGTQGLSGQGLGSLCS